MLNVAIAVDSPNDYGPNADQVVAAACDEVIGVGRCPVARELAPGSVAAWYAIVHPRDRALDAVHVEFRDRTADGVLIEQRELSFSAQDSLQSRLESVGSVIAALAAAREGSVIATTTTTKRAPPLSPAHAPPPPQRSAPLQLELAGMAVPTFGDGPYRLGGLARALLDLGERPFALVSTSYSVHPGNPSYAWWSVAGGAGVKIGDPASSFHLELGAEVLLEHTHVAVTEDGERDSAGQFGWGGRFGVEGVWANWQNCSFVFGVSGAVVVPRLNVVVASNDAVHIPLASADLLLGLRFGP